MNKYKARDDKTVDKRESGNAEGPNVLREDVSSNRQTEHRSAQSKQKEPEYKPKHGKKWPAVLLAGIAAAGIYDAGIHHQEVKKFLHVVETSISEGMQQAQQPPYKKVAAEPHAAVHYGQLHAAQHPTVVKEYVTRYVTRYVARQVAQSPQMTPQQMEYNLQNRQLSLQYRLQEQQLQAQEQAQQLQVQEQRQQLALQQQQQVMQYQIQQRYAAIQQMQGMAYAVQNYANAYNMFRGRY